MIIALNGREDLLRADDACPLGPLLDELRRHLAQQRMVVLRTELDGDPLDEDRASELAERPAGEFERLELALQRLEEFAMEVLGNLADAIPNVLEGARQTVAALGNERGDERGDDAAEDARGDSTADADRVVSDTDELGAPRDETTAERRDRGLHYLSMVVRDTAQILNTLAQLAHALDANFNLVHDGEGTLLAFANTLTGILRAINDAVAKDDLGTARGLLDRAFKSELGRLPKFLTIIAQDLDRTLAESAESNAADAATTGLDADDE